MYIHDKYLVSIICYLLYSFWSNDNVIKMNKEKERGERSLLFTTEWKLALILK